MTLENLLSGLIGAVVGGFLVLVGGWLDRRRREKMATRAVLFEVSMNSTACAGLAEGNAAAPEVSNRIWTDSIHLVAGRLTPTELNTVALAYAFTDLIRRIRDRTLAEGKVSASDKAVLASRSADFSAAAKVLRKSGYGRDVIRLNNK